MEKYSHKKKPDYLLAIVVFALVMFGLIAIYSVSKYYSLQITDGSTDKYYLIRQLIWVGVGLVAWVIFQGIDYKFWQKNSKYMLYATLFLLVLPVIVGLIQGETGGKWIGFGSMTIQPAELAKLTMIFYLASWLAKKDEERKTDKNFIPFAVFLGIISFLMLLQEDLGTLGIIVGIAISMYFMSGAPYKHVASILGFGGLLAYIMIKIEPYRMQRFLTFLNPENDSLGSSYHIRNALIAIGSGGLFGRGFGQSKQKYLYLPEAHTDSIFAIVSEELGFLRASLVVLAFGFIGIRGYKIAKGAPDMFSRLVAVGITTWLIWQAVINIGAMLSLLPLTGVPLPFVSYGGSSLVILLAAVGVLVNISKYAKKQI